MLSIQMQILVAGDWLLFRRQSHELQSSKSAEEEARFRPLFFPRLALAVMMYDLRGEEEHFPQRLGSK